MKNKITNNRKVANGIKANAIEKAWDWNSRVVPEDGYIIEELNWVIGEDVMLKEDFVRCVRKLLNDLYKEIKHGDKAHQKWLKDKVRSFSMGNVV